MGNCYCCSNVQYNGGDGEQKNDTKNTVSPSVRKSGTPTYTTNQLFDADGSRGKSRRGGRPMITEG